MRALICAVIGICVVSTSYAAPFTIKTHGFPNQGTIPVVYSCDGSNLTPSVSWSDAPAGTKSFVLIMHSPDATIRNPFYNWVLFNIPATATGISENAVLPEGTQIGNNSLGEAKYNGPCPPDDRLHHYILTVYALDKRLDLSEGTEPEDVLTSMKYHILKEAKTGGSFKH